MLIPLALAALFTFLFSPLVTILEEWLGRIVGITLIMLGFLLVTGLMSYVLTNQVVEFSHQLPTYRGNIEKKLNDFHLGQNSAINRGLDRITMWNLVPAQDTHQVTKVHKGAQPTVLNPADSSTDLSTLMVLVSSSLDFLESGLLVFLLVIFMLFNREDIRGRFIHLIGPRHISSTTRAIDDAGEKVSYFLYTKLLINVIFGVLVAIGLYFIGIPNPILWGGLSVLLRFIPYLGPWIAAIIPMILSLAISPGWISPLLTFMLFIVLDLVVGNVLEPLWFATGTGLSSLAILVTAVFWTILWGAVGLLLSIPLTVCIVVLGRHIPNLQFLSVLLGDEESFAIYEECYQRLINLELSEAILLINNHVKTNSYANLFDSMFIPMLSSAEMDHRQDFIEEEQLSYFHQNMKDILDELGVPPPEQAAKEEELVTELPIYKVLAIPAQSERDELASIMLSRLLMGASFVADVVSQKSSDGLALQVREGGYDAVCISLVAPASLLQARRIFTQLHQQMPELKIIMGLWGHAPIHADMEQRLAALGVNVVVLSLSDAVAQLEKLRLMKGKIPNNDIG